MPTSFIRSYTYYVETFIKWGKVVSLGIITRLFYVNVFKHYFTVDVDAPLTSEKIMVGILTLAFLGGLLVVSKVFFQKNEIMQIVGELAYKLMVSIILLTLATGILGVLACGQISEALVAQIGKIKIWKTFWTDSELLTYCVKKTQGLKDLEGINLHKVVEEAKNNREKCEKLLTEAVEKVQEENENKRKDAKKYRTWLYWLLGITYTEETNTIETTPWTWFVGIVGFCGLLWAASVGIKTAIVALNNKTNNLQKQTDTLQEYTGVLKEQTSTMQEQITEVIETLEYHDDTMGDTAVATATLFEEQEQRMKELEEKYQTVSKHSYDDYVFQQNIERVMNSMGNSFYLLGNVVKSTIKIHTGDVSPEEILAMFETLTQLRKKYKEYSVTKTYTAYGTKVPSSYEKSDEID